MDGAWILTVIGLYKCVTIVNHYIIQTLSEIHYNQNNRNNKILSVASKQSGENN